MMPVVLVLLSVFLIGMAVLMRRHVVERRRSDDLLRTSEARLAATLNSIGDGVISTDPAGRVVALNRVAESLTGWTEADARGQAVTEIFSIYHVRTRQEVANPVWQALREGRIVMLANDTVLVARDGTERQIADSCAPIRGHDGRVLGAVLVFRDVTEEYYAKRDLQERVKELTCLQRVRDALRGNPPVEKLCQSIVGFLPEGMQYPEIASPRIELGDRRFGGEGAAPGTGHGLHADVESGGEVVGRLSVFYTEEKPFLLPYEQNLVNAVARILGHALDRRRAEEAQKDAQEHLAESLAFTETLLAALPVPVFIKDTEGRYRSCNRAFTEMVGMSSDEIRGKTVRELWPGEHAEVYHRKDLELLKSGQRQQYEFTIRDRHGNDRDVLFVKDVFHNVRGEISGIVGAYVDITQRKRAEEELRDSRARLATVIGAAQDAITMIDAEGKITLWNEAAVRIFRYSAEEVLGRDLHKLLAPERFHQDQAKGFAEFRRSGTGKAIGRVLELTAIRKGGEEFPVELSLAGVPSEEGWQAVGILRDITDRKHAEQTLQQALRDLEYHAAALESANLALEEFYRLAESATRAKSEFLANMSHEIRTPMTAILGYAELLLREEGIDRTPELRRQAFQAIHRNGEHLLALINDILDLSKVEAGKLDIEPTRFSPCELLEEVVSLMRVRADAKQLTLRTENAGPVPQTVLTDPLRLRQVLVNLVGNAIKFTDQGEVRITISLTEDCGPSRLCFDVTDTGIGMNAEQIRKLFRPFSQVDSSASRKTDGTGLGLAISKRLIEAINGSIEVHSAPGRGSTFRVTIDPGPLDGIPTVQPSQRPAIQAEPTAKSASADRIELSGRILVAEDGPDNQRLIGYLLTNAGADVTGVDDGRLAVEAALAAREAGEPFDVILMDMQMPVMDGYTATRQLRQHGFACAIIALTAHAMAEDRQKCLEVGCDDYASKPVDRQRLLATVAKWLPAAVK